MPENGVYMMNSLRTRANPSPTVVSSRECPPLLRSERYGSVSEDRIEAWNQYIRESPNKPQCTEAHQDIINAEFQIGVAPLAEGKDHEAARRVGEAR